MSLILVARSFTRLGFVVHSVKSVLVPAETVLLGFCSDFCQYNCVSLHRKCVWHQRAVPWAYQQCVYISLKKTKRNKQTNTFHNYNGGFIILRQLTISFAPQMQRFALPCTHFTQGLECCESWASVKKQEAEGLKLNPRVTLIALNLWL